ncbi:hypothetical protein PTTG_02317 [Puccinia triticina 1-1 BBBD Race 1]|uniref:Uncharacterized protein n=1 Tax=Puccinia triticina (isolate 1-1 / race 1 (BBBD)) TaxID=630390 RepID=A0A180G3Q6_PUCT1|nr:hypothetical protein PTTG_02317 [Puccinia triticina 1-1 BBBD Race 1]
MTEARFAPPGGPQSRGTLHTIEDSPISARVPAARPTSNRIFESQQSVAQALRLHPNVQKTVLSVSLTIGALGLSLLLFKQKESTTTSDSKDMLTSSSSADSTPSQSTTASLRSSSAAAAPKKKPIRHSQSILNLASATLQLTSPFTPDHSAIRLKIDNQTAPADQHQHRAAIRIAQWPTKLKNTLHIKHSAYRLSSYRGTCFNPNSIPPVMKQFTDSLLTIAEIDQPSGLFESSRSAKSRLGWVYFDLIKPNGYLLHLQAFIKLSRSGTITSGLLGRFDLDSSRERPMPSGQIGTVEILPSLNLVLFRLTHADIQHEENTVDDTPLRPPLGLPTKRLSTFSYVSHPQTVLSFRVGKDARYHEHQRSSVSSTTHLPKFIRSDHTLGGLSSLHALLYIQHANTIDPILHRSASINPLSGLVTEGDKTQRLASTADTKSVFLPHLDLSISYGFHDSRMGKRHSMYAYATPNYSSWLGDLIDHDKRWLDVRFSKLVLQGSHDAGMFTSLHPGRLNRIKCTQPSSTQVCQDDHEDEVGFRHWKLFDRSWNLICPHPNQAAQDLQHRPRAGHLQHSKYPERCDLRPTPSRYPILRFQSVFYRPGYCFHDCLNGERGRIHHQHACVPGYEYVKALEETFSFLVSHPKEIVVFELKSDGFISSKTTWRKDSIPFHSMIPTKAALASALDEAKQNLQAELPQVHAIRVGGPADLDRPIGDLLKEQVRFIIIHRMGQPPEQGWDWERDDSYDHTLYDTDRPDEIIQALDLAHARNSVPLKTETDKPHVGTIYQLQATPTKSIADDILTSLTYSKASSLLVYTKANLDPFTYSWVKGRHFIEPGLVVLLNDFVDSVLTEHAIEKSKIRAGLFSSL